VAPNSLLCADGAVKNLLTPYVYFVVVSFSEHAGFSMWGFCFSLDWTRTAGHTQGKHASREWMGECSL